jgi:hypothetical protein
MSVCQEPVPTQAAAAAAAGRAGCRLAARPWSRKTKMQLERSSADGHDGFQQVLGYLNFASGAADAKFWPVQHAYAICRRSGIRLAA